MFQQVITVTLLDGTQAEAVLVRSVTWGEATIILLLAALVILKVYELWVTLHKRD